MFKLLKLAIVVGALAAVWTFVPVGGKTLQARWTAAGSPMAFVSGGWAELNRALQSEPPAAKPRAGTGARGRAGEKPDRPVEGHTERDREAVDRIVAEHLRD
jgi:hypothetical protein